MPLSTAVTSDGGDVCGGAGRLGHGQQFAAPGCDSPVAPAPRLISLRRALPAPGLREQALALRQPASIQFDHQ